MKFLKNKHIIFITPIILWLLSQLFLFDSRFFYIAITLGFLLLVFSFKKMEKSRRDRNWPLFLFFPALFFLSVSLYITLIPNFYWIQTILILSAWFNFAYIKNLYYHFNYNASGREEKLDTLMIEGGFLSVFALASSVYGLPVFLGWSVWPLLLIFTILTAPLFFQSFVRGTMDIKGNWPFFLASILILAELSLVVYFLPLSFNILGFFVAIFYYLLSLVLRVVLKGDFSGRSLKFPFGFSLLIVLILLLTSRWF